MEKALELIKNSPYIISQNSWQEVERRIHKILSYKKIQKIILLPKLVQKNTHPIATDTATYATMAIAIGIIGWTTWTIMDEIRDEKHNDSQSLYMYSILRPIMDEVLQRFKISDQHLETIRRMIGVMEYANCEACTFSIPEKDILKSIGAAIPMIIFLVKSGADEKSIDMCYGYFYHLIGARQLSDDACDWREDMKNGHRTLMTEWLEETIGKNKSVREYKKACDEIVAAKVDKEILWHARKSIGYARKMTCFKSTEPLEELPRFYEDMILEIIAKHKNKMKNKKLTRNQFSKSRLSRATSSSLQRAS